MKKRRFLAIGMAIVLSMSFLTGCDGTDVDKESKDIIKEEEKESFGTFVVLSMENIPNSDITQYIMYDPETMVMWTFMDGYRCGGPAIIYNADGSPKIYQP